MKFKLSKLGGQKMDRWPIPSEVLQQVLSSPEQVVSMLGGWKPYQSEIDFGGEKNYLARVIGQKMPILRSLSRCTGQAKSVNIGRGYENSLWS